MLSAGRAEREVKTMKEIKIFTKAENGCLSKVIEYKSGVRVEIPIHRDGSVRWFDDNKLLKSNTSGK